MNQPNKASSNIDMARYFIENTEGNIISEIFEYYGFDCFARRNLDPAELDALIRNFEQSGSADVEILSAIIGLLHKSENTTDNKRKAEFVENVKVYIRSHISEPLLIEAIAAELHISYYYMCHLFKQQTGMTLSAYRNNERIKKAALVLISTDKKISDIAAECGFDSSSYFSELFSKLLSETPTGFRHKYKGRHFLPHCELEDLRFATMLPYISFIDGSSFTEQSADIEKCVACDFAEKYGYAFSHEAAITEYEGTLYASWYNCCERELEGYTPIVGMRSRDGGRTWSELEIIADDKSGKILYCPPIYGICDDKLYIMINEMVAGDHMHALDLYVLNEKTDKFELLWSRPIPFKLNTNVVRLDNGKLIIPGRIGELDGFPNTPAVLISDSGKIDAEWRVVKVAEDGSLPDGKKLVHPETTLIYEGGTLYMFCRNDQRRIPLVYTSEDLGESWSVPYSHDIPYIDSKIYAGTLSDGRHYLIANTDRIKRTKLSLYLTEPGSMKFNKRIVVFDCETTDIKYAFCSHYPSAVEAFGKLYIITTVTYHKEEKNCTGVAVVAIDLKKL